MRLRAALAALVVVSCQTPAVPEPWEGKIYVGAPDEAALVRGQTGERVACASPAFGEMICMSAQHFESLLATYRFYKGSCGGAEASGSAP